MEQQRVTEHASPQFIGRDAQQLTLNLPQQFELGCRTACTITAALASKKGAFVIFASCSTNQDQSNNTEHVG
jgi:hypothetical protein